LRDRRLVLVLALALLAGFLAYQAPPVSDIAVGWLGDRLFLRASQGLGAADATTFYGDELTGTNGGRSRWTRQQAEIALPGLGPSGHLALSLRAQGWPDDALNSNTRQPNVTVTANGVPVGRFTPTSQWSEYSLRIPASVGAGDRLAIAITASDTFTSTRTADDPARPKGIRLDYLSVRGADSHAAFVLPPLLPLALLVLDAALALLALVVLTGRPTLAFVLATLLITSVAIGLALARVWAVALLPWLSLGLALLLLYARRAAVLGTFSRLLHRYARGAALNYGLVVVVAAWLAYVVARASATYRFPGLNAFRDNFPDSLLYGLLGMGLLLLIVVLGREGLPRLSNAIVRAIGTRRGATALLALAAAIWIGYEAYVIAGLPYVGHADYADNAVVARNLVAGRGWVVDYVTQFYQLYRGVTRPQETWPLLQPVWIAPFFALFGPTDWAAKIPNLLFMIALTLLIYAAGARLWDRRVGLTGAAIILTSYLFFRLVIYATSDLAFVLFAFGAIYLLYLYASKDQGSKTKDLGPNVQAVERHSFVFGRWSLVGSAVLTGLMLLQKPGSGVLIAFGMGLWFLFERLGRPRAHTGAQLEQPSRYRRSSIVYRLSPVALWSAIALAILSPYVVRNLELFRAPFYSTESRDAWLIEYTADWEDIYRVYSLKADPNPADLPNRSWILRHGFDRTLLKIENQVRAIRDYLAPPWSHLPLGLSDTVSGYKSDGDTADSRLLLAMGAWLALLGALGALRSRRRLLALLLAAFGPYTLFLVFYWHANEERYFVMLLPWLALLAAYALWRGYDRVAAIGDGRWTPVGLALVATALVLVISPSWPEIARQVRAFPQLWAPDVDAYTWLRDNAGSGDVVMTRGPWQANWQSDRPTLMIPNTGDRDVFLQLARHYGARYLVRDTLSNPSRQTIALIDSLIADGTLTEVYVSPKYLAEQGGREVPLATEVYRFSEGYGGVAALEP
jgi:hypothetical protein